MGRRRKRRAWGGLRLHGGWLQGAGGAHFEHVAHVSDAGRVEAQRLVEDRRALPSRERRVYDRYTMWGVCEATCGPGGRRVAEGMGRRRRKRHAGRCPTKGWGPGTGGAHKEHLPHLCDAGRVKAERLVKRRHVLPSRKESIRCWVRCEPGGVRAWGVLGGANGMRGHGQMTNLKHLAHVCDAGRIEVQRLVEGRRALSSWKAGIRCRMGRGRRKQRARGGL